MCKFLLGFLINFYLETECVQIYLARSSKVFIRPAKVAPPDFKPEITFFAGD